MLILMSGFIAILYTYVLYFSAKKLQVRKAEGKMKCVPMAYGMMFGTLIGLVATFLYPGDLAVTTVVSMIVSSCFAVFVGKLFDLAGIIEALGATLMGAMMGAMLAAMTPDTRISFMLIAMDLFYVAVVGLLLYFMKQHSVKKEKVNMKKVTLGACIIAVATCTTLVSSVLLDQMENPQQVEQSDHMHHHE